MALRWTAAELMEAKKGSRRLKAYWQVSALRSALQDHMEKAQIEDAVETIMKPAQPTRPAMPPRRINSERYITVCL